MFNSDRSVLIFATLLALIIIGSIVEGYVLHDQIVMTPDNWKSVLFGRFAFHLIGVLPLWILCGFLMESVWKAVVLCLINLALMNINPIYDLAKGPIVIKHPQPEHWTREEFNNPSSDVDFSTREVPMIRLEQEGRAIMMTEERWKKILENCDGQIPVRFMGLENMEVELEWECD